MNILSMLWGRPTDPVRNAAKWLVRIPAVLALIGLIGASWAFGKAESSALTALKEEKEKASAAYGNPNESAVVMHCLAVWAIARTSHEVGGQAQWQIKLILGTWLVFEVMMFAGVKLASPAIVHVLLVPFIANSLWLDIANVELAHEMRLISMGKVSEGCPYPDRSLGSEEFHIVHKNNQEIQGIVQLAKIGASEAESKRARWKGALLLLVIYDAAILVGWWLRRPKPAK